MLFGSKADRILAVVGRILGDLTALMKEVQSMSSALDRVKASVATAHTVNLSAVTLLQGISARLREVEDGAINTTLGQIADEIDAETHALAEAVTANTPAAAAADTVAGAGGQDSVGGGAAAG